LKRAADRCGARAIVNRYPSTILDDRFAVARADRSITPGVRRT
jgi:hypothetical protein